jgi:hypothetical protein
VSTPSLHCVTNVHNFSDLSLKFLKTKAPQTNAGKPPTSPLALGTPQNSLAPPTRGSSLSPAPVLRNKGKTNSVSVLKTRPTTSQGREKYPCAGTSSRPGSVPRAVGKLELECVTTFRLLQDPSGYHSQFLGPSLEGEISHKLTKSVYLLVPRK